MNRIKDFFIRYFENFSIINIFRFLTFILVCFSLILFFTLNTKADIQYDIKGGTQLYLNYDYLSYISENKEDNLSYSYSFVGIYNSIVGTDTPMSEPIELYINKNVYDSQYLEIYVYNDDIMSTPKLIFKYNEGLGEYIFYIYNVDWVIQNTIPFSSLTVFDVETYFFITGNILSSNFPYLKTTVYTNSEYSFNNSVSFDTSDIFYDQKYLLSGIVLYTINYNDLFLTNISGIEFSSDKIYYYFNYNDDVIRLLVYNNGWVYDNARFIRIYNCDVNLNLYYRVLLRSGSWINNYSVPDSNMKDLIFAYADIPYKITKSMTSFEILGTSLFSILGTVILIILVIKIIKKV